MIITQVETLAYTAGSLSPSVEIKFEHSLPLIGFGLRFDGTYSSDTTLTELPGGLMNLIKKMIITDTKGQNISECGGRDISLISYFISKQLEQKTTLVPNANNDKCFFDVIFPLNIPVQKTVRIAFEWAPLSFIATGLTALSGTLRLMPIFSPVSGHKVNQVIIVEDAFTSVANKDITVPEGQRLNTIIFYTIKNNVYIKEMFDNITFRHEGSTLINTEEIQLRQIARDIANRDVWLEGIYIIPLDTESIVTNNTTTFSLEAVELANVKIIYLCDNPPSVPPPTVVTAPAPAVPSVPTSGTAVAPATTQVLPLLLRPRKR